MQYWEAVLGPQDTAPALDDVQAGLPSPRHLRRMPSQALARVGGNGVDVRRDMLASLDRESSTRMHAAARGRGVSTGVRSASPDKTFRRASRRDGPQISLSGEQYA